MKPTFDNVLIKKNRGQEKTASGIALPPNALKNKQKGQIEAIGPNIESFKPGMKIVYSPHEDYLKYEDDDYVIVSGKGIVAIL